MTRAVGRHLGQTSKQDVPGDLLVERLRAEAVGARKVEHPDGRIARPALKPAFLALDGHAGIIAHPRPQAGQGIENSGLTRVGIAGQNDISGKPPRLRKGRAAALFKLRTQSQLRPAGWRVAVASPFCQLLAWTRICSASWRRRVK